MRTSIILLHHLMLQISIKNRHVYQRWLDVITQMIEKDPGNPLIHRLRVIHLYECDYNLLSAYTFENYSNTLKIDHSLTLVALEADPTNGPLTPFLST